MRYFRLTIAAWTLTAMAAAQGIPTRPKLEAYPVHISEPVAMGAEYMVHSFSGKKTTYVAKDHLVIEVGIFPAKELMVSTGHFTLRMNGKKQLMFSQPPQFVAAALKWPDWENTRRLEASAGVGDASIGTSPQWEPRFPGDNRRRRLPAPTRAPVENPAGELAEPAEKAEEVVVQAALREGATKYPIAGYLYFAFKGKPKSIKSLELIYDGPAGPVTLKLL